MGTSAPAIFCLLLGAASFAGAQSPEAPPVVPPAPSLPRAVVLPMLPEMVLASAREGVVDLAEFGLGDGGIATTTRGELRQDRTGCTTAGGVRVECREVGVKLTFPSGRELLVAPDGNLHLRSGAVAGPFPQGVELRLGDGTLVRISLASSQRERVRDVVLVDGDIAIQPWQRGARAVEMPRVGSWAGIRLVCCGDGGDLYRPIALGPLLVLERVLVEDGREDKTPEHRLVVLAGPLVHSLGVMRRQHREPDARVRHAMTAVAAVADRSDVIFPVGATLQRAERDELRWLLPGGFELAIDLEGTMAPRLQLFAGRSPVAMIEWTLRGDSAAFLANPRDDYRDRPWHGNGTRLPRVAIDLQAREHLFERAMALGILAQLRRAPAAR
jgi:hypothetical protein